MTTPDVGVQVCVLVHHLFRSYPASRAFYELTLRCGIPATSEEANAPKSVSGLMQTQWYANIRSLYTDFIAALPQKHVSDFTELTDMVKSLYPSGCSASEFAGAVQICAEMVTFTIPNDLILSFVNEQCEEIGAKGIHEISVVDLTAYVHRLMLTAMIPPRWWMTVTPRERPKIHRIGLRTDPMQIGIEYEWPPGFVRCRRISLHTLLPRTGPTGPLAKRLSASHYALMEENEIQRLLIKLQYLKQHSEEKTEESSTRESLMEVRSGPTAGVLRSGSPTSSPADSSGGDEPQKADLGLLYRDPERALRNVDLNDADEITVREFKDVMNQKFKEVAILPGDERYVYDKRVKIKEPTAKSAWDESDED